MHFDLHFFIFITLLTQSTVSIILVLLGRTFLWSECERYLFTCMYFFKSEIGINIQYNNAKTVVMTVFIGVLHWHNNFKNMDSHRRCKNRWWNKKEKNSPIVIYHNLWLLGEILTVWHWTWVISDFFFGKMFDWRLKEFSAAKQLIEKIKQHRQRANLETYLDSLGLYGQVNKCIRRMPWH